MNIENKNITVKFKPTKKHFSIFKIIIEKGYYKPTYSDQEPATKTLEKNGIVKWREDYGGVEFTEYGKKLIETNGWYKYKSLGQE